MRICILHLVGDELLLLMAYLSADEQQYERKSIWSYFKSNSKISDVCQELSRFPVTHSQFYIGKFIQSQSKGRGFENFLVAQPQTSSFLFAPKSLVETYTSFHL